MENTAQRDPIDVSSLVGPRFIEGPGLVPVMGGLLWAGKKFDGDPLLVVDDEGKVHNSIHQVYLHPIMVILLMAVLQEVKEKTGTRDCELFLTSFYITFRSDPVHR